MVSAGLTFFFDIRDFPARGHFAVPADDASAGQGGETEKPNETHHESPLSNEPPSNFRTDEMRDATPAVSLHIGRTRHGYRLRITQRT